MMSLSPPIGSSSLPSLTLHVVFVLKLAVAAELAFTPWGRVMTKSEARQMAAPLRGFDNVMFRYLARLISYKSNVALSMYQVASRRRRFKPSITAGMLSKGWLVISHMFGHA